jgi:chlorite dismutase
MEYRRIGKTDIDVSVVGFGTWTLSTGWWGEYSDAEAVHLLREARSLGINFIDASDSYGYGLDDQEFVVAFEADDPAEFLDLVHDLRSTEASRFTLRDTPMFTCILRSPREMAAELGVAAVAAIP